VSLLQGCGVAKFDDEPPQDAHAGQDFHH
jgi:hypothetical protein